MSIWREVKAVARVRAEHPAIRFAGETITYGELALRVERQARFFAAHGIVQGDRVCLLLPNTPDFAVAYYALVYLGAVAVSVNVMCKAGETAHIVNDAGAVALVTSEELRPELPVADAVVTLRHIFIRPGDPPDGAESPPIVDVSRDMPAAILYTSGTTGKPKGAVLSHGNVISNAHAARHVTGMQKDDVTLCFLPLFHCFGQNVLLNATLFAGATLALERRFSVEAVLDAARAERVTMLFGVPTAYIALLGDARAKDALRSVRYSFSAAAILPRHVEDAWHALTGMHVHEGYGLTETSPFASYNHTWSWKPGSVGAPLENVELSIQDEAGQRLGDGEVGEICIRGPNVMLGYWQRPEETRLAIRDGWFRSGDIGCRDGDGDYFIVDRVKDMINVGGFKVWPREVEEVLFAHEAVREVAVIGVPDAYAGESVKAFVVVKDGATLDVDELTRFCDERLSRYKVPKQVEVVSTIPKGATGKMLKRELRSR